MAYDEELADRIRELLGGGAGLTEKRPMDGWLRVDSLGVRTKPDLERWVKEGVSYARSLPPKR